MSLRRDDAPAGARAFTAPRTRSVATVAAVGVALAGWAASGVYTVSPNETGVITRFGSLHAKTSPGMHYRLPWPVERTDVIGTTDIRRVEVGFHNLTNLPDDQRPWDVLTGDENILHLTMVVQYKVRRAEEYLFRTEAPGRLVERVVEAAMNECVARLPVDEVLTTAKQQVQVEVIEAAQRLLDAGGAGVVLLGGNLQEVAPPASVIQAFKEVASAKKDAERAAEEAREYAEKTVKKSAGDAQTMIAKAEGYRARRVDTARGDAARFVSLLADYRGAESVTRTRLFVEAMERILMRAKVVILGDSDRTAGSRITIVGPPAGESSKAADAPSDSGKRNSAE